MSDRIKVDLSNRFLLLYELLRKVLRQLHNWGETDFSNQCRASCIFGFILCIIFCLMRDQRSQYASSSLKHAMTGLLWGAKTGFSRIKANLAAAKNTHDSGNKQNTDTQRVRLYNHTLASSLPSKKNTAHADTLITRLRLSQEYRHTPGKPNRFDILLFKWI